MAGAHALIIRSATQVTAEVLAAGTALAVVGRAGVGLDNVDVPAATARGVMVVNAPTSNILSVAEQAMALLLAQARNIPQAHAALVAGRWERSKWEGVELHGKVLGVVGLGRAGSLVAQRAQAFGMGLIGFDPFVSAERARAMGVRLVTHRGALRRSRLRLHPHPEDARDHRAVRPRPPGQGQAGYPHHQHRPRGHRRRGGAGRGHPRRGGGRGGARCVRQGAVHGLAPLRPPGVVVSPHLGASTEEAQDKAGVTIAEQVELALAGDFVPYAVNVAATDVSDVVRPFMPLAEQLGRFFGCLHDGLPDRLEIEYQGELAAVSTGILTLSALKGVFGGSTDEPVSYVNAPQLAEERGLEVRETSTATSRDYKSLITLRSKSHSVAGHPVPRPGAQRAAHGHGRRPHGRGAALAAHAGRAQRRPAGDDRHGGHCAGRGRISPSRPWPSGRAPARPRP